MIDWGFKMKEYEYCLLDVDDEDELSVEEVLKQINEQGWTYFEANNQLLLEWVAKDILKENYANWEIYEEDEGVYLAVKEVGEDKPIEVHRVNLFYVLSASSNMIFDNDDFKFNDEKE
ncbi:hypothetical protein DIS05_08635 [Pasteurella multocida]|nr:hypothetical protein DIS05_08635 [Pasteurella multocida]EPE64166.1 hypothetical protein I141_11552 [Pasteurella multocida P1933]